MGDQQRAARLALYITGDATAITPFITECFDQASALVNGVADTARLIDPEKPLPDYVRARCVVEVGNELYHRRAGASGTQLGPDGVMAELRLARDPLSPVYPMLGRHLVLGL
ncbi:MAG: hypothetical protein LBJ62_05770 [Bifidobacteriaceae bacterium]|jgi:hypothetical protein|nr:hypothetical protein [Bifidobacteriaceae bacterium]